MKESDIRNISQVYGFFEKEHLWLSSMVDEAGCFDDRYITTVQCPCCGIHYERYLFRKDYFDYVECKCCRTVYVNPRFKKDVLSQYYLERENRLNYIDVLSSGKNKDNRLKMIFEPRKKAMVQILKKHAKNRTRYTVLDIGCATGQFLSVLRSEKKIEFKLHGIEASEKLSAFASKEIPEATIYSNSFENSEFDVASYDIITLWEVLEHAFDPFRFLNEVNRILTDSGFLFVSVPNLEGFDIKILWDMGHAFSAPSHLNYYRLSTVNKLLDRSGFEVLSVTTPGKLDVDIVRNRIDTDPRIRKKLGAFIEEILDMNDERGESIRTNLQEFLQQNNLSSHMVLACKKK